MGNARENKTLKESLQAGETVLGTIINIPSPQLVECVGWAGLDFVMIDGEHGPISTESMENMVRAADVTGISGIARVRKNENSLILRVLDIGMKGVHVPSVQTATDAQKAARALRYWPEGDRGLSPSHRAARFGQRALDELLTESNRENLLAVHIEDEYGVSNANAIAAVPGVDIIFIGPMDLSQSLGVPGQTTHPRVREAIKTVFESAKNRGKFIGTGVGSVEAAVKAKEDGYQYILLSTALRLLAAATQSAIKQIVKT